LRFLEVGGSAADFLRWLRKEAPRYAPFNVLVFDGVNLLGYESRHGRELRFLSGIHGLSNGDFDEPWPKVEALKSGMAKGSVDDEVLLTLLRDPHAFPDDHLPHTGVSIEWERSLSAAFVRTPTYGTRASTILRLGHERVSMLEQQFSARGREGLWEFEFQIG